MHGFRREVAVCRSNRKSAIEQIVGCNIVSDVDDGHVGIDLEDYTFQRAHKVIICPVIRGQGDNWVGQNLTPRASSGGAAGWTFSRNVLRFLFFLTVAPRFGTVKATCRT